MDWKGAREIRVSGEFGKDRLTDIKFQGGKLMESSVTAKGKEGTVSR